MALAGRWIAAAAFFCACGCPLLQAPAAGDEPFTAAETRAALRLRRLAGAQARFQAAGRLDRDRDGLGEYGFLSDLALAGEQSAGPPRDADYLYLVYLPGPDGRGLAGGEPCPERCGRAWCAYAWPVAERPGAARLFFVEQGGSVRFAPGRGGRPRWDAACPPGLASLGPAPWPAWGEWAFLP